MATRSTLQHDRVSRIYPRGVIPDKPRCRGVASWLYCLRLFSWSKASDWSVLNKSSTSEDLWVRSFVMPYSFPMEHLAIMAIILEEPQNRRRQRRWGVHPLWKNRSQQGEFQMCNTQIDHEDKFYNYFKMPRNTFEALLDKIKLLISRNETNWKRPISPGERLAICLR